MLTPAEGVISFGALVVLFATSGILVLINARRLNAWGQRLRFVDTSVGGLRFLGGAWILLGLFCVFGVVHWASQF